MRKLTKGLLAGGVGAASWYCWVARQGGQAADVTDEAVFDASPDEVFRAVVD